MELQGSTEGESTRNAPALELFAFGTRRHENQPTGVRCRTTTGRRDRIGPLARAYWGGAECEQFWQR
jgi:hypothetical protein